MLEGLYGAEKRQNLPQKRKRPEVIQIDDDDDEDEEINGMEREAKRNNTMHHQGTGIIGEYMREGKQLGPPSVSSMNHSKSECRNLHTP